MESDRVWIIVNCYCLIGLESEFIPAGQRPTCLHVDKDTAEKELLRLQRQHPLEQFVLFESIARAEQSEVNSEVYFVEGI